MKPWLTDARLDTTGGLASLEEVTAGAECFRVLDADGAPVLHYALAENPHARGSEVVIVAAAGSMTGVDLVRTVLPYIERQASGAAAVCVHTRRRGLVAKMAAQGYQIDGFILRKKLV